MKNLPKGAKIALYFLMMAGLLALCWLADGRPALSRDAMLAREERAALLEPGEYVAWLPAGITESLYVTCSETSLRFIENNNRGRLWYPKFQELYARPIEGAVTLGVLPEHLSVDNRMERAVFVYTTLPAASCIVTLTVGERSYPLEALSGENGFFLFPAGGLEDAGAKQEYQMLLTILSHENDGKIPEISLPVTLEAQLYDAEGSLLATQTKDYPSKP